MITQPSFLKNGDQVALTCPAGYMPAENADTCISTLQNWGYDVWVGKTLGSSSTNFFSGTDNERLGELQAMLDNKDLKAIFFGRGGYGVTRIIDQLNFTKFKKNPKWLIGFSDITALHTHVLAKLKIASIHAQMAAAYNDGGANTASIVSLHHMLKGKKNVYTHTPHAFNVPGKTKGRLIGGNVTLLANTIGTASEINTDDCILFLEDIGEYLYSIDRLLVQLKRSKKFRNIQGLIFGGFTDMKDTVRPFGKSIEEICRDITADLNIPTCHHFPVSHTDLNHALKIGGTYQLQVTEAKVVLKEI